MEDSKNENEIGKGEQKVRHDLVNTAVNFLLNPAVINKADVHKTAFLKKKGLTDEEISLAYKQAENDPKHSEILRNSNAARSSLSLPPPVPVYQKPVPSFWTQISRFSSSLIVLGVALFGAHYLYKTYIEPLLFGEESDRKKSVKVEKQLFEMASSISQLEKHVLSLEDTIKSQKGQMDRFFQNEVSEYYPTPLALRELKTEIAAIKSLLLNRHQFPALPKVTPTIPHWQLPSKENESNITTQNGETSEPQQPELKDLSPKSSNENSSEDNEDIGQQINGSEVVKNT